MPRKKAEPNAKAMTKAMDMFNGQGRGAELSSAKGTAYGLLCSITEFIDHERRAMSTDHRLDSAWFGAGAAIKQRGLEQALRMVVIAYKFEFSCNWKVRPYLFIF